jgi:hypothetical protein
LALLASCGRCAEPLKCGPGVGFGADTWRRVYHTQGALSAAVTNVRVHFQSGSGINTGM